MTFAIRDRATFEALARSRSIRRGGLSARATGQASQGRPSVAYAISREVGSAVARNRARRRLRAAVRANLASLRSDRAYLFSAGRAAVNADFAELRRTVATLVEELS